MNTADVIQLALLILTFLGLFVTIGFNLKQFSDLRKQIHLQVFADYTKRYQEIKFHFPSEIYEDGFDPSSLSSEKQEQLKIALRAYFDLCSKEFYLFEEKRIEPAVWAMWKEEIISSIQRSAFWKIWSEIRREYLTYPTFVAFMDKNIGKKQENKTDLQ